MIVWWHSLIFNSKILGGSSKFTMTVKTHHKVMTACRGVVWNDMTMSVMYYRIISQFVTRQPRGDMAQKVRFNTIALTLCVLSSRSDPGPLQTVADCQDSYRLSSQLQIDKSVENCYPQTWDIPGEKLEAPWPWLCLS